MATPNNTTTDIEAISVLCDGITDDTKAAPANITLPAELIVWMHSDYISEYRGTRAMLEAEGVIPKDFTWPHRYDRQCWNDDKYKYWLCRHRPDGAKGSHRQFADVDWWHFRWQPLSEEDFYSRTLKRKAKELADYTFMMSPEGRQQSQREWEAFSAVCDDKEFKAFMALIPGITKPPRGRRPKNANKPKEGSA